MKLNLNKIRKYLEMFVYAVLAVSFIFIIIKVPKRVISENKNDEIEICVDWDEVYDLCYKNDYKLSEFLKRIQAIGVSSVSIQEETLASLVTRGRVVYYSKDEYERMMLLDMLPPATKIRGISLVVSDRKLAKQLESQLKDRYSITVKTLRLGRRRILYPVFYSSFRPGWWSESIPLGFDPEKMSILNETGLKIILRPRNKGNPKWLDGMTTDNVSGYLWGDSEVPGYPGNEKILINTLKNNELKYIDLEFTHFYGDNLLNQSVPQSLVQGHVITNQELEKNRNDKYHLFRWIRAVKERSNRFLLFHFWKNKPLEDNLDYLRLVAKKLKDMGYTLDIVSPPDYPLCKKTKSSVLIILACAVLFPILAVYAAKKFQHFFVKYIIVNATTIIGGLLISALLYNVLFMKKIVLLPSVKLVMIIPLIAVFIILFTFEELKKLWFMQVRMSHVFIFLMLFLIFGIMMLRSGNYNIGYFFLEENIRQFLENVLGIRPRSKEFLFGQPLLLLGFYFKKRYLICLGFISQVSIINTFLHAHSPVVVSLVRTFHGLWLGLFIGFMIIGIIELINKKRNE
ncbi:MAG: hypothetical protein JW871_08185 [Endomicrobiales bacterium]|nr:hypothetical protein [Endomicrobiales bacterium]